MGGAGSREEWEVKMRREEAKGEGKSLYLQNCIMGKSNKKKEKRTEKIWTELDRFPKKQDGLKKDQGMQKERTHVLKISILLSGMFQKD